MSRKKIFGTFLIAVILLAGTAQAEGNPDAGYNPPDSGQVSGWNEVPSEPEVPPSGPLDPAAAEKASVPTAEAVLDVEAVNPTETAAETETVPGTEAAPAPESPPQADAALEEVMPEEADEAVTIADPIEPWNRFMFHFNDKLYFWGLKPLARGYNAVVPEPVRVSVRNFFRNVAMPVRFVNCLLQGKLKGAGIELSRFGINSVIGLAGFFDVAKSRFELSARNEDFGQTLGFYGMDGLMYVVWPFLGPSTVRDTIGFAGDSFLNPLNYIEPFEAEIAVKSYERVNSLSLELGNYEEMKKAALEPYIAIRDAFIQYRNEQIKN